MVFLVKFEGEEFKLVMVLMWGNDEVNEIKVVFYLGCEELLMVFEEDIEKYLGVYLGFLGLIGVKEDVIILVD